MQLFSVDLSIKMKKFFIISLIGVIMLFSAGVNITDALMVALSTNKLTKGAQLVIRGKVEKKESLWSTNKEAIVTHVFVNISDVLKGTIEEEQVLVEIDGGEVGDLGLKVSDTPEFKVGEEVILFLTPGASRVSGTINKIVGSGQGKYSIGVDGIARKDGFSVVSPKFLKGRDEFVTKDDVDSIMDKVISVDKLTKKIKKIVEEDSGDGHIHMFMYGEEGE